MRILLDENLPKRLKFELNEFDTYTIFEKEWCGLTNGKLLDKLKVENFDVLITFDKNLQFQQNFVKYPISVIILNTPDNTFKTLLNIVPRLKELLAQQLRPGPILLNG